MKIILAILLAASAFAQTTVVGGGGGAVLAGSPPGGIGGACDPTAKTGYLDASGNLITCPSGTNVWTVTGGGVSNPFVITGKTISSPDNSAASPAPAIPNSGDPFIITQPFPTINGQNDNLFLSGYMPDAGGNYGNIAVMRGLASFAFGSNSAGHTTATTTIFGLIGQENYVETQGDNTVVTSEISGLQNSAYSHLSNSPTADMHGTYNYVQQWGAGVLRDLYGTRTHVSNQAGTARNLYGEHIQVVTDGGSTTGTAYGLFIDDITGATTANYAIKTGAGRVLFGRATEAPGFQSVGTTFAASGCGNGTLVGGSTAGKFTSGDAGGSCSITITMGASATAANGWSCQVQDLSAPSKVWGQSASSTTTATFLSPGVTTSTNVVSFFCVGY